MAVEKPILVPEGGGERLRLLGQTHHYPVTGAQTGGRILVLEQHEPAGTGIPFHVHEREDETFYIVSGAVEFDLGDATVVARAGAVLFGPRGVPHGFRFIEDTHWVIAITPAGIEEMFRELARLPEPLDFAQVPPIIEKHGVRFVQR